MMHPVPHPWQSAKDEFDLMVLPKLQRLGRAIGAQAREGDELCQRLVQRYEMLYKSFDPMTLDLLKRDLEEYESRQLAK